jgi:hypothetical protein
MRPLPGSGADGYVNITGDFDHATARTVAEAVLARLP